MTIESDGRSADSFMTFDERRFDPETGSDDPQKLAIAWISSDELRRLLEKQAVPTDPERLQLKGALVSQLNTLVLYWRMGLFLLARKEGKAPGKKASLYVLMFPGEAKDNTGLKDLNDKVIGQWWSAQFIRERFKAIGEIFDVPADGFTVTAQTYKTAYILTYDRKREDFAKALVMLDARLREILMEILKKAEKDASKEQLAEIKKLWKKLDKNKKYRFDIFFGLRTLKPSAASKLEDVYLLVTEALKGAAIARYVAKVASLKGKLGYKFAAKIPPDKRKLDARGKEYVWRTYMTASNMAEKLKSLFVQGYTTTNPYAMNEIYVDTVWTFAFMMRKNLYWANPDVVRDVRKKRLKPAPLKAGLTYAYSIQKNLLELWLVVLNMLDFIKRFKFSEFHRELLRYHEDALDVFTQVGTPSKSIDWAKLIRVLTHDVRQKQPIAQIETASEFQFYSFVADHSQRIFFSMDIRDLGVEQMLHYEHSNRTVGHQKYSDRELMEETFRASDEIDERRRHTYDRIVDVFRKYHGLLSGNPAAGMKAARQAFGGAAIGKLGSFAESVQILLGGDEFYAAVHPLFALYLPLIVGDLDRTPYGNRTIDMRASVAFSSAPKADIAQQRREIQLSHQEAMKIAEEAPAILKHLERTDRRIEQLIEVIEKNDKKKSRAPGYRQALAKLALTKLFARAKHGAPAPLPVRNFRRLLKALKAGDIAAAVNTKRFELVDFSGNVVDAARLESNAAALEQTVRRDVGTDNIRGQIPPAVKIPLEQPKWQEDLIDTW